MLARKPKTEPSEIDRLFTGLVIPERPIDIETARERLQAATEARLEAERRHIEASQALAMQRPGRPATMTRADVDDIGQAIQPAIDAEAQAREYHSRLTAAYDDVVNEALAEPLRQYHAAIDERLAEVDDLLRLGMIVHHNAVSAKANLPHRLPGAAGHLIAHLDQLRKFVAHSNR